MNFFKEVFKKYIQVELSQKEEKRRERIEKAKKIIEPILLELRHQGYNIKTAEDLKKYKPFDNIITGVLLEWTKKVHDEEILDWLIGLLSFSKAKFSPDPLLTLFENTTDFVKFRIIETFADKKMKSTTDWIRNKIKNGELSDKTYVALIRAVGAILPAKEAISFLYEIFKKFPGNAAETFSIIGGKAELEFLKREEKWVKENFDWWHDEQVRLAIVKLWKKCKE